MHLSVSFLKKGGVVSWEVVPKLKKDCPGWWFVITFCHGFHTIWTKNSESKGGKGHENMESFYAKPTYPGDLWKVSFPLWHSSFVILLVGPTLLWKGREICLNLYSNKFCRLEFGGDIGTHSCFIWVVCVINYGNLLFQLVHIPLFQPISPACRFQTELSRCETVFSLPHQGLLPLEFGKGKLCSDPWKKASNYKRSKGSSMGKAVLLKTTGMARDSLIVECCVSAGFVENHRPRLNVFESFVPK